MVIFLNKLLIATNNDKKLKELAAILGELGFACVSLKDMALDIDPEETGTTFAQNARIKAICAMEAAGIPAIADDSGLCCTALRGAPGVYSARYCPGSDSDRTAFLLQNMADKPDRSAYFVSAICCAFPNGDLVEGYGECHGQIAQAPAGGGGFGYDPVFYVPEQGGTFSEIPQDVKNRISHRAHALQNLKENLLQYFNKTGEQ